MFSRKSNELSASYCEKVTVSSCLKVKLFEHLPIRIYWQGQKVFHSFLKCTLDLKAFGFRKAYFYAEIHCILFGIVAPNCGLFTLEETFLES